MFKLTHLVQVFS